MTRNAAENVMQALLTASRSLDDALALVKNEASDSLFKEYRKCTGEVMGAIYLDLMKPIVEFYPDLDPGRDDPKPGN